jgi:hypothetical protein
MTERTLSLLDPPPAEDPAAGRAVVQLTAPEGWPAPPAAAAFHGLVGQITQQLAPNTEADPVAILSQLLVSFGAAAGRGAYFQVEATRHYPNQFLLLVGESARARKGSSWDHVARLLQAADPTLAVRTGLSTGEGIIWCVRDPTNTSDSGVHDQRLLVIEPEFATVLKQTQRDINTLSPVLRSAWDGRPLAILTRTAPARATNAHISVIGHITATELRHHLTAVELANGFTNRFLFLACRRVRLLPEGGDPDPLATTNLPQQLKRNLTHAKHAGQIQLHPDARELWHHTYNQLSAPPDSDLAAAVNARAEAHTIRLAVLYTLTDGQRQITTTHLNAAIALRDYTARSAIWALTPTTTNPLAEQIHTALRHAPNGLTRTQLRDLHHRNASTTQLDHALQALANNRTATRQRILTAGRPAELWTATTPTSAPTR